MLIARIRAADRPPLHAFTRCLERITDEPRGTSQGFGLDPVGRPLHVTAEN